MTKVILYDIPTRAPAKSWSLNPLKTRMILNYKGIDYQTQWVEYPDLVATLKAIGLPPNDPTEANYFTDYTSPAVRYADGTPSMDSWKIAHELEERYPSPPLHLDDPIVVKVRDHINLMRKPLDPWMMPKVPTNILGKESAEYFELTRAERYGMQLSQLAEKANEDCWEEAKGPAIEIAELLKKKGGPYFIGKTVSYADFILVSFLHCMKRIDVDMFQRYLGFDPAFGQVYDASRQWLAKDD
ncbi:hypothetical protein CC80DRAFT_472986 [Byssothecium circinans]|uniref:GST N-terminal domain-containing protein n=1 Tax=Byssothecium circinans TaxID=147558 RepID=A0A6A5TW21_9PLEO|nr:hypothetical protein CC80DRAFT_472986 [Byssothecium circinans]